MLSDRVDDVSDKILNFEPMPEEFFAFNWGSRRVNGNSIEEILDAIGKARVTKGKSRAMVCDTACMQSRYPAALFMNSDVKTAGSF